MKNDWLQYAPATTYQGECGSCTVFAGCRDVEVVHRILTGERIKLAEQDLLACSGGTCEQGNTVEALFERMKRGIPLYECCPYQERTTVCGEGRCDDWHVGAKRVREVHLIENYEQLQEALSHGPVMATLAIPQSLMSYKSKIYTGKLGAHDPIVGYHMVDIHGQDTEQGTVLMSNHWKNWGLAFDDFLKSYCLIKWDAPGCELTYYRIEYEPTDVVKPDPKPEPNGDGGGTPWFRIIVAGLILIAVIAALIIGS